ncbi:RES family NAD+ phosphorylase [Amorphus sp. 3PC139-8]|uniref:RES family NAD+ phosphorylase n=1 Tax=Amorphus sp. 3PC139-8 TaxID=2735676 RepID=UPI00345D8904
MTPAERRVRWRPSFRIIPSRFPPIGLFETVADPDDLEAVYELEAMTNPRVRDEVGELSLVPSSDRISGAGSSVVMAAFTHLNPNGSRFSDGSYGVYYAAKDLETAVAETRHHREAFMRATAEAPIELEMRVYLADLDGTLHDIRRQGGRLSAVYDTADYSAGRALGRELRERGSDGIVYDSVRRRGGTCAAVFRPRLLSNVRQERHLAYVWDGERISAIYERREM